MASNKELIGKILEIEPNHSLNDSSNKPLTNDGLAAELKRLKEKAAEGKPEEQADGKPGAVEVEKTGYRIAKGRALTVHGRGVLGEGCEIKADWLPAGEEQLAKLIAKGHVE